MSKERKFHELIEQGNQEEKQRVWEKILAMEKERQPQPAPVKKRWRGWQKWTTVLASVLAVLFIGVFAVVKFFPFDDGEGERYFTNQDYEMTEKQETLQEYSQKIGADLLYFDWYQETDYCKNNAWLLKDTQEIVSYNEEMVDINTGCVVYLYVTKVNTELEFLSGYQNTDQVNEIHKVKVNWRSNMNVATANFEYQNYRYYLRIVEPFEDDYILSLVEELLTK